MHRKEGLMFKNMGQTYADMKKLHEEAAGMPLEDMFMDHLNKPIETQDLLRQMANRSFEQAKYEWECQEEWRFADRDAERKFFYNAGKNDKRVDSEELESESMSVCTKSKVVLRTLKDETKGYVITACFVPREWAGKTVDVTVSLSEKEER